jgi:hypothetical protein
MRERLSFKDYRNGYMTYLRHEDLEESNQDIRYFNQQTLLAKHQPTKY